MSDLVAEPRSSLPVNNSMTSSPYSGKVQAATVYSSQPGAPQQGITVTMDPFLDISQNNLSGLKYASLFDMFDFGILK